MCAAIKESLEYMDASGGAQEREGGQLQPCRATVAHGVSWAMLLAGALLLGLIGTWLVWFSFMVQHKHNEDDIRTACQRVMPETVERCVDTVIIQRGGMRR